MKIEELPPKIRFLFMTIGQAAIKANDSGFGEEQFVEFCKEMWKTMEINGVDKFFKILNDMMISDLDSKLGPGMSDFLKGKK